MPTVVFVGAGNMAEAIARGLLRTAVYQPCDLRAIDPDPERQRLFKDGLGIACADGEQKGAAGGTGAAGGADGGIEKEAGADGADIVILAVKPFVVAEALRKLAGTMKAGTLVVSIAAGISTRFIEEALGAGGDGGGDRGGAHVIRVMPNTPMLVGKGISALCRGTHATEHDLIAAERIFATGGQTVRVTEELMDAVTAVSGSGPAYVFFLTESLAQAGVAAGLSESQAGQLARQTVIGAAALLEHAKDSPAELRRKVTTPNGTTQAAIESLQGGNFGGLMTQAIAAAAKRSRELGK